MATARAPSLDPVRRLLAAVDAKAKDLCAHLHPAWIESLWQRMGLPARTPDAPRPAESAARLVTAAYDLRFPRLDDFRDPVTRMAVLDRGQTLRVLATCALARRRTALRMAIRRDTRETLVAILGQNAYDRLTEETSTTTLDAPEPLSATELNLEALAHAGYQWLCQTGAWTHRDALAITRMSLAPSLDTAPSLPANERRPAEPSAASVIPHIHYYLPELAWLFGSEMNLALSA